jgi:hypothetical protein
MFDFDTVPVFEDRTCGICEGFGVHTRGVSEGVAPMCTACKKKGTINSVFTPEGRWVPTAAWRTTQQGALFFEIKDQGVELTWDDLAGACGYLLICEAESELIEIYRSLLSVPQLAHLAN